MKLFIDCEKHLFKQDEKEIFLSRKEFEILQLLCSVHGKVFSREQIFSHIWGKKSKSKPRTVDVHIVGIRKKIGNVLIRTIVGVGYKISVETIVILNNIHLRYP